MLFFPIHYRETSSQKAHASLDEIENMCEFLPNLLSAMATSPALTQSYVALSDIFSKCGLSAIERQVVLLTASNLYQCKYCIAAHYMTAKIHQVPDRVIDAIQSGASIFDSKLEALRLYVKRQIELGGLINESEMDEFLAAGYQPSHALDVLVGISQITLSKLTNHMSEIPLDNVFFVPKRDNKKVIV